RHGELIGGEPGAVEFFGEFQQRIVTAGLNGVEDGAGALLDDRVEQAGRRGQFAELGGKICVGVADNLHAFRLKELRIEVKKALQAPKLLSFARISGMLPAS